MRNIYISILLIILSVNLVKADDYNAFQFTIISEETNTLNGNSVRSLQ
jgi:hypothetical protein